MKSLSVIVRSHFIGNNFGKSEPIVMNFYNKTYDHVAPSVSNLQRPAPNNRKMPAKKREFFVKNASHRFIHISATDFCEI